MTLAVKFSESIQTFSPKFGEVNNVSDGGYDRGYAEGIEQGYHAGHADGNAEGYADGFFVGYADGHSDGHKAGYEEGLAARTYETWTVYYVDGSVEKVEVPLL